MRTDPDPIKFKNLGIYENGTSIREFVSQFLPEKGLGDRYSILPARAETTSDARSDPESAIDEFSEAKEEVIERAALAIVQVKPPLVPSPSASWTTGYLRSILPSESGRRALAVPFPGPAVDKMWTFISTLGEKFYTGGPSHNRLWFGNSPTIPVFVRILVQIFSKP